MSRKIRSYHNCLAMAYYGILWYDFGKLSETIHITRDNNFEDEADDKSLKMRTFRAEDGLRPKEEPDTFNFLGE